MAILWSILTSKIAGPLATALCILLGCLLIAALVSNGGLKHSLADVHRKLEIANTSLATCKANEHVLNDAITVQNAAVDRMKAEGDQRAKEAARAVSDAHRATETLRQRERRVAGSVSHEACGDDLILGSVR